MPEPPHDVCQTFDGPLVVYLVHKGQTLLTRVSDLATIGHSIEL